MEMSQLTYFKAVAQYGSFTKAADALHVTQSALSRSIGALEQDVGFPVFERKGNHIYLTIDGQALLTATIEALNLLSSAVDASRARAGLEHGAVRIGIAESVFLKNIVRQFLWEYPTVHIFCKILSEGQIQRSLEEGEINFAVTRERPVGPKIQWEEIFSDRMMVRFPPNHPLIERDSVYLTELSEDHFIISNVGYDMQSEIVALCHLAGFHPHITYEGCGEDLAGLLVDDGLGIMLAPYSIGQGVKALGNAMSHVHAGVPIMDDFASSKIGIATKKGQFQSDAARKLMEMICGYYKVLGKKSHGFHVISREK